MTAEKPLKEKSLCGALKRQGGTCERPAGWGTGHVGTGRCKLHGGNAGRPSALERSAPPELRYAFRKLSQETKGAIIAGKNAPRLEVMATNASVTQLFTDTFAAMVLERQEQGFPVRKEEITAVLDAIDSANKQHLAVHKVEYDERTLIPRLAVHSLIAAMREHLYRSIGGAVARMVHLSEQDQKKTQDRLFDAVNEGITNALDTLVQMPDK